MAKITIVGDAVVVTSTLKLEDLKLVGKYQPDALVLKGGENGKEPIFAVKAGTNPELGKFGAVFTGATRDDNGFATITLKAPEGEGLKEKVADLYGCALVNIGKLEEALPTVVDEINAQKESILGQISVQ